MKMRSLVILSIFLSFFIMGCSEETIVDDYPDIDPYRVIRSDCSTQELNTNSLLISQMRYETDRTDSRLILPTSKFSGELGSTLALGLKNIFESKETFGVIVTNALEGGVSSNFAYCESFELEGKEIVLLELQFNEKVTNTTIFRVNVSSDFEKNYASRTFFVVT